MSSKSGFREGTGYTLHQADDGFYLDIDSNVSVINYPFKVKIKNVLNVLKVIVKPGTANNIVPKMGGTQLDADTPPSLALNVGTNIIALKVTYSTATFFPDDAEIVVLTSNEALTPTDNNGFLQLASVVVTEKNGSKTAKVNQYIYASQIVVRAKPGSGIAAWSFLSR